MCVCTGGICGWAWELPYPGHLGGGVLCTGLPKSLDFFGFPIQIPSLAGSRVLFLGFKRLLQRAKAACGHSFASEASFGIRPGRNLRVAQEVVQLPKRVVTVASCSPVPSP